MNTNHENQELFKRLENISGKALTVGNLIWAIRQGEQVSQVEFAQLLGISRQYLCDLENGRRIASPKMAAQYAQKLGYSEHQFVRLALQEMLNKDKLPFEINLIKKATTTTNQQTYK